MKNNKKTTYLLLALVAIVWGLIFYRVFNGISDDDEITSPSSLPVASVDINEKELEYELFVNYRDPFLGKAYLPASPSVVKVVPKKTQVAKKKEVVVKKSSIKIDFLGLVQNATNKKKVGIIRFNGKEQMAGEGEVIGAIKVIQFQKDSVLIQHAEGKQWFK